MKNEKIISIPPAEEITVEEAILLSRGDVTIHDPAEDMKRSNNE